MRHLIAKRAHCKRHNMAAPRRRRPRTPSCPSAEGAPENRGAPPGGMVFGGTRRRGSLTPMSGDGSLFFFPSTPQPPRGRCLFSYNSETTGDGAKMFNSDEYIRVEHLRTQTPQAGTPALPRPRFFQSRAGGVGVLAGKIFVFSRGVNLRQRKVGIRPQRTRKPAQLSGFLWSWWADSNRRPIHYE